METTPVILGLTRQAQLWGLPMPYTIGVMMLTVLPFIWMDALLWVATGPVWYIAARLATAANPNGAQVLRVVLTRTPHRLSVREKSRRYV
jgi:type IV secretion system protein VirB3